MVFQHIEKLKQEYTDKYVVVDETRPELARFKNQTGIVRTVNMSGRALVEFDAYDNIGWYDIDVDFLKIIDKPREPQATTAKSAAKSAAKPAAAKPKAAATGGAAAGGKMSVADMLAAARAEKESSAKPAEPAKPAAKMSVADMLAAARAEKSAEAPAEAPAAEAAPAETPAAPAEAAAPAEVEETPAATQDIPSDIPGILAYCRKVDG